MGLLKKNGLPWMKRGRWYKIFLESNGTSTVVTSSDIPEVNASSNTHVNFPHDFEIVDVKTTIHNVEFDSGSTVYNNELVFMTGGAKYIAMPTAKSWDYATMWVFGYRNGEK